MKRDEAERTEAISIDQMWSGVRPLSSLQFLWLLPGRRLGGEERPLWAHLLEGRDEHWTEERGKFSIWHQHQQLLVFVWSQVKSTYNMYKLLGYDILLDSHSKPHLIEVNARPACLNNPLDAFVNRPMVGP